MNLQMTIFDNRHNKLFDISEVVDDITISTDIEDQPGKCTFNLIRTENLAFWEGATVSIKLDGVKMFKGYVFSKKRTSDVDLIKVTAYDQLRYLKNKDSAVFENMTSSQIFSKLCEKYVLKYKVVSPSNYICTPKSHKDATLYDMISHSLSDTLYNTKKWFIIRDNYGTLEHIDINAMKTNIVLGDGRYVSDFDYESSIDKDVYNQIKLYRDNKETGKREVFIVNDSINNGDNFRWGLLQLHSKVSDNLSTKQIEQRAIAMLGLYNNTSRRLKLKSQGISQVTSGSIITLSIKDLGDISLNENLLVTKCTHTIKTFSKIAKASNNDKVDVIIGDVISVSPLKVSIGDDLILTESFLIKSKFIQEKIITAISPYNSTSFNIKLWDGVKVGD